MDRPSRQKNNKATEILNDTIEPLDLIDKFSEQLHPKKITQQITHSFQVHEEHAKTSLNKFKKIKIISSIFSDHNGIKLETNHRKRNEKKTETK